MGERWTVGSVNGMTKTGNEGEWKTVEQIQGQQTSLRDNVFGVYMRAIKVSGGEYLDPKKVTALTNIDKLLADNDSIQYALSEVAIDYSNPYYRMMEEAGLDVRGAVEKIKKQLNSGRWTYENVDGLREYGVVIGIITRLEREDAANGFKTNFARKFREDPVIELMMDIEWDELNHSQKTPEEKYRIASQFAKDDPYNSLNYFAKKYGEMQAKVQEGELSRQAAMLETYMGENGIGLDALLYLIAKNRGTIKGMNGVEQHLVEIKKEQTKKPDDQTR